MFSACVLHFLAFGNECKLPEIAYLTEFYAADMLLFKETWLDDSREAVDIPNYTCISRKDRSSQDDRGSADACQRSSAASLDRARHGRRRFSRIAAIDCKGQATH